MFIRTTAELDEEQPARSPIVLAATGIEDTIDPVLRLAKRKAFLQQVVSGDGLDIGAEALARARPRLP